MDKSNIALFDIDLMKRYLESGILKYSEGYDIKIRVGETFTLKICFNKERPIFNNSFALLDLLFEDSNGHYWSQPLFACVNKIYDSRLISHKEYHERLSTETAIEGFKNPKLR